MKSILRTILTGVCLTAAAVAQGADKKPIIIGNAMGITGPLNSYAVQLRRGVELGFEYATHGTNKIDGRPIKVIEKDTQLKPGIARAAIAELMGDDNADIVFGPISSGVSLAVLPVAQQYHKIIMPWGAADSITGSHWNRYVFRVDRNSSQDAISNAFAVGHKGVKIATVAQDYAFGHDFVTAYKAAVEKLGASVVHEEYPPAQAKDFTATGQQVINSLRDLKGDRYIFVYWAGPNSPVDKIQAMEPERYGIKFAMGGGDIPGLIGLKQFPGLEGAIYYYYEIPHNPVNDWLVKEHFKRFNAPPDLLTVVGFAQAQLVAKAIEKTGGSTKTEDLMKAMEGMRWQTPKGEMYMRPQDHQTMTDMYAFKVKVEKDKQWAVPEVLHVIKKEDMNVPIENKR